MCCKSADQYAARGLQDDGARQGCKQPPLRAEGRGASAVVAPQDVSAHHQHVGVAAVLLFLCPLQDQVTYAWVDSRFCNSGDPSWRAVT